VNRYVFRLDDIPDNLC